MMLYFLSGSGIMGVLLSERFRLDAVQELDEAGRRRYFVAGELCVRHVLAAVDLGHIAPDGPRHAVEVCQAHGDEHEGDGAEFVMGLEVVLLLLSEPALLDALVVGVLGLEVDAPAALQGAAIVRLG